MPSSRAVLQLRTIHAKRRLTAARGRERNGRERCTSDYDSRYAVFPLVLHLRSAAESTLLSCWPLDSGGASATGARGRNPLAPCADSPLALGA